GAWGVGGGAASWGTRGCIRRCGVSKSEKGEQSTPYRVETVRLSKSDPARDLNLPRSEERAGDPAETRAGHRRVRRAQVRAVERVVEFSQRLKLTPSRMDTLFWAVISHLLMPGARRSVVRDENARSVNGCSGTNSAGSKYY